MQKPNNFDNTQVQGEFYTGRAWRAYLDHQGSSGNEIKDK